MKPRVGICAFTESRSREEVYRVRGPIARQEVQKAIVALEPYIEVVYPEPKEIRSKEDVLQAVKGLHAADVDCALFLVPIWVTPSHVAAAGRLLRVPPLLLGNARGDSISQTGLLAAGGALNQVGVPHKRVVGDIDDKATLDRVMRCIRSISAVSRLRGQTFGCIGGRSLGILTASADPGQWQRIFGVDIEHVDQSVLIREAEGIGRAEVDNYTDWVKSRFSTVDVQEEILKKQVRSYLATRKLVKELELDFIGIKCQTDLSDWYCLQCLNVSLLGDPYDIAGPKAPTVCSCEADCDGALTMQILNLLSGGKPTALMDIRSVNPDGLVLANCGSAPTWFASRASDPMTNTKRIRLVSHIFGKAGGASMQFVFGGGDVTLARLWRNAGTYWMAVVGGQTLEGSPQELQGAGWPFPYAFVRSRINSSEFLETFGSNHIHVVAGNVVREIETFCDMVGIACHVY